MIVSVGMLLFLLIGSISQGQHPIDPIRAYDGMVEYQKIQQPARLFEFRYAEKDLEDALESIFQQLGGSVRFYKGMHQCRQVRLSPAENRYFDVYYKVAGIGKGSTPVSTLSIVLAETGEDILIRSSSAYEAARALLSSKPALAFFDSLGAGVGAYELDKRITMQEDVVRKAEKRQSDLYRKRQRLESELADNQSDLDKVKAELERAQGVLSQIQSLKRPKS